MDLDDLRAAAAEAFPPWFWYAGAGLVVGIGALLIIWYLEHPDRSPWEDFARGAGLADGLPRRVPPSPDVAAAEAEEARRAEQG